MFGLFKRKKETVEQPKSKVKPLFREDTRNLLSQRYSFKFKGDVDRETFERNTIVNVKNKLLPIDINPDQIIGYARHKGVDIGVYRTGRNGFGFYLIRKLPIRLSISFIRKEEPDNAKLPFHKDILNFLEFQATNEKDKDYIYGLLDMYIQKYLLLLIPQMNLKDKLVFNRNGLSLELDKGLTPEEVNLVMSFLYQMSDSFIRQGN